MSATQLGMFAKFWQPGQVKTRLAAAIGHESASRVYRTFIETLLDRFGDIADQRVLVYWPLEQGNEFARLAADLSWGLQPQGEGDLGARMSRYFAQAFAGGARRAVLIGSDSPTLPREFVRQAFDLLKTHQAVLGPSEDGGYYLLGLAGEVPSLFAGIPWSTSGVYAATIARLKAAGVDFAVLPAWYDVDDIADLRRLAGELADASKLGPELTSLRRMVYAALGET